MSTVKPPGWEAYTAKLQRLAAAGAITAESIDDLMRAGKRLAVTAFEAGADAMHAASLEAVRSDDRCREPRP